uniref:TauD/TfdA family dioxygenase n=1 Tax=Schlesneria paludicola TaxID=360056 RepID=A0A7C2NZM6_9PLAN
MPPGKELPLVIGPDEIGSPSGLRAWLASQTAWLNDRLVSHGALLFRGFDLRTAEDFQDAAGAIAPKFLDYTRGSSPRNKVSGRVYTSTEAPPGVPIALHCELSYIKDYPDRICFFCETPPARGGQTPIADMRAVYLALDPNVRRRFEERGLRFIQNVPAVKSRRNYRTWPEMFATENRSEVEQACRAQEIQARWKPDGTLQLINTRPATIQHPVTGETIWFNSAHNQHDSWSWEFRHAGRPLLALLARLIERRRRRRLAPEDYPNHCTFADGGEIPRADIEHIRQVLWDHAVLFDWQQKDLLVLDNLRIAHGRMPFRGPRRILVAMGLCSPVEAVAASGESRS